MPFAELRDRQRRRRAIGEVISLSLLLLLVSIDFGAMAVAQATSPPPPATPSTPVPESAPADTTQSQDDQGGGFVFKKEVEEVVLHAIVVDDQNHLITSLARDNFQVFEDGKVQELTFFRKERVPVALGILIDNSGSMLPKRTKVNEAALQLVSASQHEDRVFVVNFGEDAFLDQDYTGDVGKLKAALERVETHGSTALYDALIASADHLTQGAPQQKKVLLAVTDGRDSASQATFAEVLHKFQSKNGPVVYTIALEQDGRASESDRQSLRTLSEQTGGAAFFPESIDEVQSIARSIAQDIRSQYVIGYRSSNPQTAGTYHPIQVQAISAATRLRVSTRQGYYSGNNGAPQ